MDKKTETRRLLISCGVLLLVVFLCISVVSMGYAGLVIRYMAFSPGSISSTATPPVEDLDPDKPQNTPNAVLIPTIPVSDDLPPEIAQQMDLIQEQVSELRGLSPISPVDRLLLTREELRQRLIADFNEDYSPEEAQEDAIILSAFGLLEKDFDLFQFFLDLYTEQISGFYDTEAKEMYVVLENSFGGMQRLTYAHEYVHALQDQHFDIREGMGYNDEACEEDSERCAAIRAVLEGDASLMELHWFSVYATQQDFDDIQKHFQGYDSPIFDRAPAFIQQDLLFPYLQGQNFVEYIFQYGGWEAVDRVYSDLPVSTEQILHPERYPDIKPIVFDLPDLTPATGENWREIDRGVVGEWYTYLILAHGHDPQARLDGQHAQSAAEGWGGDAYLVLYNDEKQESAMVVVTIWEDEVEASEFADSFQQYTSARFGQPIINQPEIFKWESNETYTLFNITADTTTWIFSNNEEIGQAIWNALP